VLGITIDRVEVTRILQALGLELLDDAGSTLTFRRPSWRSDLEREIDLVEEVARIHGYEHIPENRAVPLTSAPRGPRERVEAAVRGGLTAAGFDEAATFSLVADDLAGALPPHQAGSLLRVEHSSRRRESALRRSLFPSLLAARRHNEAHGNADAELFEIADVYLPVPSSDLPEQPTRLGIVSGRDFFGLKGVIEALLDHLQADASLELRPASVAPFAPGRAAELWFGDTQLGYLGSVDRAQLDALELRAECTAAELEFSVLLAHAVLVPQHHDLPAFPAVVRDLSLVVPVALPWAEIAAAVRNAAGSSLESVTYLDRFQGGNIPADQHSVHFALQFRHTARTLTGEEVDRSVKDVIQACSTRFGAVLRT
jgi:phenylalanyl-tRNA synthetase beta chain